MHVAGDIGFSSLALVVVSLAFPVVYSVIRRKWRLAVARKEEIKRLLVLASEEAARVELEATASYYGGAAVSYSRSTSEFQYCAVCFSPTTTRCARCKAVRYCSGKCQIIHWRQGHREECRPPSTTHHINDDRSNGGQEVVKEDQHGIYDERYESAFSETSSVEAELSDLSSSSGVPLGKGVNVESTSDTGGSSPISEASGASFSGFSDSPTPSGSSDDVSVSESASSTGFEGSEGQTISNEAFGMLETSLNNADHTKSLSPKFASLVDSVDSFSKSSKLMQTKLHSDDGGKQSTCTSSLGENDSAKHEDSTTNPGYVSSSFWGRALDSAVRDESTVKDDSATCDSTGACNSKLSNSQQFFHFKFNMSASAPTMHSQSPEVNDIIAEGALPASPIFSSEGLSIDSCLGSPQVRSSPYLSCEIKSDDTKGDSKELKSCELKSESPSPSHAHLSSGIGGEALRTEASEVCRSQSSSERLHVAVNPPVSTSHLSKSGLSASSSQKYYVSTHAVSHLKSGKVGDVEAGAATFSQMASASPNSTGGLRSSMRKVVDQFMGPKSGRYTDKGLFPYDLFVKLYTSNKMEMQPCGLVNCGNSCYANAVLQCLAFTPPLTSYFVQGLHSKACVNKECCFTCELEKLVWKAKEGKSPLSPIGVLSQLQKTGSQLGNGREEDAHEFLRCAIDNMQSICLKEAGKNKLDSFEEETTLICLTFGGYLRSKIKCMKCHFKSERQERMMDLTVEIEGDIGKLEDALKRFSSTEILDGDNKYQCSRCKSYEKAKKRLKISEAPNILTIALKRFQSGKFGKLNKSIQFPEILDLAPYMSGTSDKSPIYRLYGVVVHLDVMNAAFSGHYVCYVKNIQNKWFKIDDSSVTAVDLEKVLTKGAYMLLYARCSPRAPRLLRSRIVSPDPKVTGNSSRINGKHSVLNSGSASTRSSVVQLNPNTIPQDSMASVESFYLKFHRLKKILEEDSSSDNNSFTSSNSDEGSCSTDSTRDSTSTDDLSDFIFGGWNSPWRSTSDSDTSSSSSSPFYSRNSSLANEDQSGSPKTSGSRVEHPDTREEAGLWDREPSRSSRVVDLEGKGAHHFLHSDTAKQCRKLSGSTSCRETDSAKLGNVKSGMPFRRSMSERTD